MKSNNSDSHLWEMFDPGLNVSIGSALVTIVCSALFIITLITLLYLVTPPPPQP